MNTKNLLAGTARACCFKICMAVVLAFDSTLVMAANPDSGVLFSNIGGTDTSTLHLERIVIGGKEYNYDLQYDFASNGYKTANKVVDKCFASAPVEQYPEVSFQGLDYPQPPTGFQSVIAWLAAVNRNTEVGSVQVRALRVYGVDADGNLQLVTDKLLCPQCDAKHQVWGWGGMLRSDWRKPEVWASWGKDPDGSVYIINNGIVNIPTSTKPNSIFHAWNAVWPLPAARSDWKYFAEAEVLPTGSGMIQIGLDYWETETSGSAKEGARSSWICFDNDYPSRWITVRTPLPGVYAPTAVRLRSSWKRALLN